ncbi:MAG: hypothetical protein NTX25_06535 [Proteobacteria bacterium]|nr:hypothetical protein [Pseudomonadota bacterium]
MIKAGDKTKAGPAGETKAWDKLGLEEIVHIANKVGLAYVDAKKAAEYYELMKPTVRARVALRLDDGELSEARLKRLTETDPEYLEFLEKLLEARRESDRLKVRYDSYKNLFDARRSMLSFQKEEMKLL